MFKSKRIIKCFLSSILLCFMFSGVSLASSYKLSSGEVLKDPTRPHNWHQGKASKGKAKDFTLNYILKTAQGTRATINGKKVTEGDWVSGAKVISIMSASVIVSVDGKRRTLRLNKRSKGVRKVYGD